MRAPQLMPVAIAALLLVSCGKSLETAIIGVWHGITPPQSLHFNPDGTVLLKDRKLDRDYRGLYQHDGARLEMQFESFQRPVIRETKVSGDTLTLSRDNGPPEVLHR